MARRQHVGAAQRAARLAQSPARHHVPGALAQFRVEPYLQLVQTDSITVVWWSPTDVSGTLDWGPTPAYGQQSTSAPVEVRAITTVVGGVENKSAHPYRHEIRLAGLEPDRTYFYRVRQGGSEKAASFRTAVGLETDFTFVVAAVMLRDQIAGMEALEVRADRPDSGFGVPQPGPVDNRLPVERVTVDVDPVSML